DLVRVRQIAHAQHAMQMQFRYIHVDVTGNVGGQALDFDFALHLVENAAFGFDAHWRTEELDADAYAQRLIQRNALHVNVDQLVLDGLALPIDDHGLGGGLAGYFHVKNGVVAFFGKEDPGNLSGINLDGDRIGSRAVKHGGNFAGDAYATCGVLVKFALAGLGCNDFRHSRFPVSGTGMQLLAVSPQLFQPSALLRAESIHSLCEKQPLALSLWLLAAC